MRSSKAEFGFGFIQLVPVSPGLLLLDILPLQGFACTRARRHATPSHSDDHPVGPTVSLASTRPIHFLRRRAWPIIFLLQVIRSRRGVNSYACEGECQHQGPTMVIMEFWGSTNTIFTINISAGLVLVMKFHPNRFSVWVRVSISGARRLHPIRTRPVTILTQGSPPRV
jgi:hypothetical protein